MSVIDDLTIDDFKNEFRRNFPYLPIWEEGKAYFIDDVVYVEPNFYQSLIDANTRPVTDTTAWVLYDDDINNYVTDEDIEKAWAEAKAVFNQSLFCSNDVTKLAFLYLVAYYLSYDLSVAASGASGRIGFPVTSMHVGSVSESYYIPTVYTNNPLLYPYSLNGFGLKYLSLIYGKLIGNVRVVGGATLP